MLLRYCSRNASTMICISATDSGTKRAPARPHNVQLQVQLSGLKLMSSFT